MGNRNIIHRNVTHKNATHRNIRCMKENFNLQIRKKIYVFFNPSIETIMNCFAIVERATITQEEAEELLKILEEWKV